MSSTMFAMKASADSSTAEKKRADEKRRNILVLMYSHLNDNGYFGAAETLSKEAGMVLGRYEVADNMDMGLIVGDYEAYYEMRFDKKPKLVRKLKDDEVSAAGSRGGSRAGKSSNTSSSSSSSSSSKGGSKTLPDELRAAVKGAAPGPGPNGGPEIDSSWGVGGDIANMSIVGTKDTVPTKDSNVNITNANAKGRNGKKEEDIPLEDRVLKPPPQFGGDSEMKQLAAVISREIYQSTTGVNFDDIVGLDGAKSLLCEAVQLPLKFPFLFSGLLRPWKGILLHGTSYVAYLLISCMPCARLPRNHV